MKLGSDEMETEAQTIKTEDDQDRRTDRSHQETENEKPERSRVSTIHTAQQFLMDPTSQVLHLSQILTLIIDKIGVGVVALVGPAITWDAHIPCCGT